MFYSRLHINYRDDILQRNPSSYEPTDLFQTILAKDTIRSLDIRISEKVNTTETLHKLSKMNLEELCLFPIQIGDVDDDFGNACNRLATQCPNLRVILLDTYMYHFEEDMDRDWRELEKLPKCCNIRHVVWEPPERLMNKLDELCNVEVRHLSPTKAAKFGPCLKRYIQPNLVDSLSGIELRELEKCENLEAILFV